MRKVRNKTPLKPKTLKTDVRAAPSDHASILSFAGLVLLLLFTISLKVYKSDHAGITYDESMSWMYFGSDVRKALNPTTISNKNVPLTNNHVLNSVFINFAGKIFPHYEHYIRIPSLLAGILFSCALAYIVRRVINLRWLQWLLFAWISLVPFVFDYSYLARGYAYALMLLFGQFALVLWWIKHKINFRFWLLPVLTISFLNFLACAAMLSSLLYLIAFSGVFALFYSWKVLGDPPQRKGKSFILIITSFLLGGLLLTIISMLIYGKIYPDMYFILITFFFLHSKKGFFSRPPMIKVMSILLLGASILVIGFFTIFPLYRGIYKFLSDDVGFTDISGRWRGWPSFISLLNNLLVSKIFRPHDWAGIIIFSAVAALTIISLMYLMYRFCRILKAGRAPDILKKEEPAGFIFMVTVASLLLMFLYGVVLNKILGNKSLGLERNNIFIIPMVLLCAGIALDRFLGSLENKHLRRWIWAAAAVFITATILHQPPSLHYISSSGAISGPLLRRLKAIDPHRTWNILFSEKMWLSPMSFLYYQQFDYKFNVLGERKSPEVIVCQLSEMPNHAICLDWDFFHKANCAVTLNDSFPFDRVKQKSRLTKK